MEPLCSLAVTEGDTACFAVSVSGRPWPRVSWRHNGSDVVEGGSPYFEVLRSADGRRHSLRIGEVFAEDAGTVHVTAENDVGSVSASAQLSVTRAFIASEILHILGWNWFESLNIGTTTVGTGRDWSLPPQLLGWGTNYVLVPLWPRS